MQERQLRLFRGRPPKKRYRQMTFDDEELKGWLEEQSQIEQIMRAKKLQLVLIEEEKEQYQCH